MTDSYPFCTAEEVRDILHRRAPEAHKGNFGHGLLIAGSYEMCGAAILAGRAAVRSGIGLLDIQVPPCAYPTVQAAIPEAMVKRDQASERYFAFVPPLDKYQAVAIGPGLGTGSLQLKGLERLLEQFPANESDNRSSVSAGTDLTSANSDRLPTNIDLTSANTDQLSADTNRLPADGPSASTGRSHSRPAALVLDADALNLLSAHRELLGRLPENTIMTPHPKEFERLAGPSASRGESIEKAAAFAREHHTHLVLKGHHTALVTPDGSVCLNSTGNAGMATGGSGDVLTGILLSLLAQGYSCAEACRLGVWLHGLSADLAVAGPESEESLSAGDLVAWLGRAFKTVQDYGAVSHI